MALDFPDWSCRPGIVDALAAAIARATCASSDGERAAYSALQAATQHGFSSQWEDAEIAGLAGALALHIDHIERLEFGLPNVEAALPAARRALAWMLRFEARPSAKAARIP